MVDFTTVLLKVRRKVMKWANSVDKVPIKPNFSGLRHCNDRVI